MKKDYYIKLCDIYPRADKGYCVTYSYDGSIITDVKVTRIGGLGSGYMTRNKYNDYSVVPHQKSWRNDSVVVSLSQLVASIKALIKANSSKINPMTCVQSSVLEDMSDKIQEVNTGSFVIGSIVSGVLKLGTEPKYHTTQALAKKEAARLASIAPGTEFIVLKVDGKVKASGLVWS